MKFNDFSSVNAGVIRQAAEEFGTPLYLYDEQMIIKRCKAVLSMPNAFGLTVRYAMKAHSGKSILKIIEAQGLFFDASSLNEVRRAALAGIAYSKIVLTTQELPLRQDREDLEQMLLQGLKYNVCSLRQLYLVGDFAAENGIKLAIRVHPGVGAGESATRNTGDKYSCFGIHRSDLQTAIDYTKKMGITLDHVHVHIGSGGDPAAWRSNIDLELGIIEEYFEDANVVSFGGGLKEARMPDEDAADIEELGAYARDKVQAFFHRTGRKLHMEIEPGTYIMANSGYVITEVTDKKQTGEDGFNFVLVNGGMEISTRPLLYGSRHPFYVVSQKGELLSSEFDLPVGDYRAAIIGRCCESGDSQSLDEQGLTLTRKMAEPQLGDYVVIGGTGAYCSAMSPFNYNSHVQIPELMFSSQGGLRLIRKRQSLEQIVENEI